MPMPYDVDEDELQQQQGDDDIVGQAMGRQPSRRRGMLSPVADIIGSAIRAATSPTRNAAAKVEGTAQSGAARTPDPAAPSPADSGFRPTLKARPTAPSAGLPQPTGAQPSGAPLPQPTAAPVSGVPLRRANPLLVNTQPNAAAATTTLPGKTGEVPGGQTLTTSSKMPFSIPGLGEPPAAPPINPGYNAAQTKLRNDSQPLDRSDPKYRMGIGARVGRGALNLMGGGVPGLIRGIIDPTYSGYEGKGAVNGRFQRDDMARQRAVAGDTAAVKSMDDEYNTQERGFKNASEAYKDTSIAKRNDAQATKYADTIDPNTIGQEDSGKWFGTTYGGEKKEISEPRWAAEISARQDASKNKAPTAEQNKERFQGVMANLAAEGLPAAAMTDLAQLTAALQKSKTILPEDKQFAQAYMATNTTPASTGANTRIRVEGYGEMREYPVINAKTGNLEMASASAINAANRVAPGTYLPAGAAQKDMSKAALINDIRAAAGNVKKNLGVLDEGTFQKLKLGSAIADPNTTAEQILQSIPRGSLNEQQSQFVADLFNLRENAMALRSVLGAGQGSEDVRRAILLTLPGAATPNAKFGTKQVDNILATLDRLEKGLPTNTPQRGGTQGAAAPKKDAKYPDFVPDR